MLGYFKAALLNVKSLQRHFAERFDPNAAIALDVTTLSSLEAKSAYVTASDKRADTEPIVTAIFDYLAAVVGADEARALADRDCDVRFAYRDGIVGLVVTDKRSGTPIYDARFSDGPNAGRTLSSVQYERAGVTAA